MHPKPSDLNVPFRREVRNLKFLCETFLSETLKLKLRHAVAPVLLRDTLELPAGERMEPG